MIPVHIDADSQKILQGLEADGISRFTLLDGAIRGAIISATALSAQARANHGLGILETLALSQALMGAALYTVTLKDDSRVEMRVDCTGVMRGWVVDADVEGRVRGYLFNPQIVLDRPLDSFDLKPFIGSGTLTVRRSNKEGVSFSSVVELAEGRIAEDLVAYWHKSEQTKTSLSLSVRFNREGHLSAAGGIFLQALPGAKDIDLEDAELRLQELGSFSAELAEGKGREDLIKDWFAAFEPKILAETPVFFDCPCSRERFYSYLSALPAADRASLRDEGPFPLEILCHSCSSAYFFDREDLPKN